MSEEESVGSIDLNDDTQGNLIWVSWTNLSKGLAQSGSGLRSMTAGQFLIKRAREGMEVSLILPLVFNV